jgi:hypothetical protein
MHAIALRFTTWPPGREMKFFIRKSSHSFGVELKLGFRKTPARQTRLSRRSLKKRSEPLSPLPL